jgi:uncharacterized membrane protein
MPDTKNQKSPKIIIIKWGSIAIGAGIGAIVGNTTGNMRGSIGIGVVIGVLVGTMLALSQNKK